MAKPRPYPHAEREAELRRVVFVRGEQDLPLADLDVILMRKDPRLIPSLSTRPIFWNVPKRKGADR